MCIKVPHQEIERIKQHAETSYPVECCGALIGTNENGIYQVLKVRPMRNINEDSPNTRYTMDPMELLEIDEELEKNGLEMIGIYHSHPDHPSKPSKTDLKLAWPKLSYIIVSVDKGEAKVFSSWRLDKENNKFVEEELDAIS